METTTAIPLTADMLLLLGLMGVTLVLFAFEWVAADVVALGLLITLILTGLLSADQAFAGLGSETVFTLMGLFILTAALLRTGVVERTGRTILRYTGNSPNRLLLIIMSAVATLSSLLSNTASTAFFVPIVLGLASRLRISVGKLLMPLAFASILASSVTLVSTSTNIVISGLLTRYGMAPLGMFELTPVGIPVAVAGLLYMLTIGRRLLPDRQPNDDLQQLGNRLYLTEVVVQPHSPLVGKSLAEAALGHDLDLKVLRIMPRRDSTHDPRSTQPKNRRLVPRQGRRLHAGDVLLVEGERDSLLNSKATVGLEIRANLQQADSTLAADELQLVEVLLLPRSPLIGETLARHRFRERYGLQVLAIYRHGETLQRKLSRVPLRVGDVLLLQGEREQLRSLPNLEEQEILHVLSAVSEERYQWGRAPIAIATFVGSLSLVAFDLVALPVAVLLGALIVFLTRCISVEEAYRRVEWRALVLIGSMLALGVAMEETGTASYLAAQVVQWGASGDPRWLLTAFFALAVILTQPMSNQAAAIVVVPVALQTALQLDLNPRTFAMMIAIAASTSYLTPLEPSCLMVYGPGNYRFADFLKVGSLLTLLVYGIALMLVPYFWPL